MNWNTRYASDQYSIIDARPSMPAIALDLSRVAETEGHNHINNLINKWNNQQQRFDMPGEQLLAVKHKNEVVGIGGIKHCKVIPGALELSRFYVKSSHRNFGIASNLVKTMLNNVPSGTIITADSHQDAARFWEGMGFNRTNELPGITHVFTNE